MRAWCKRFGQKDLDPGELHMKYHIITLRLSVSPLIDTVFFYAAFVECVVEAEISRF